MPDRRRPHHHEPEQQQYDETLAPQPSIEVDEGRQESGDPCRRGATGPVTVALREKVHQED